MLEYTELKPGTKIILDKKPYVVLEYSFVRMQMRKPVVQTKLKDLINGGVVERSFYPRDILEEAEIEIKEVKFLYQNKGEFWFCPPDNPGNRFKMDADIIGPAAVFLKQNSLVKAQYFDERIIGVELPIKMELKVVEAPPSIKGNTAQGGTKQVKLETGASVNVPLFINEGDIVRVNTTTGEYVERANKA
ncbi:MAG: elongation factor P [Candidatus Pacebacteria bacterium]|nr:elongation factor P [Candidatus Paceibacterota bacterium]